MKKSRYKIGDKVTVFFLDSKHESEIIEIKQHPQRHEDTIFTVRATDGLIIPYVGVDGSERFANIFTDNDKRLNFKNKQNGNKRTKRNGEQDSEEAS